MCYNTFILCVHLSTFMRMTSSFSRSPVPRAFYSIFRSLWLTDCSSHVRIHRTSDHPAMSISKIRVAILDDYQRIALTSADWSSLDHRLAIDVFSDTLLSEDALSARLQPYTIVCAMRERTKFAASLLDKLPNLKLIATTGMKNAGIDITYAASKGVVVSGTGGSGNSTLEHIWALILATARQLVIEDRNVKAGKEQWQSTLPLGLAGRTLGLVGVGRLGSQTAKVLLSNRLNHQQLIISTDRES